MCVTALRCLVMDSVTVEYRDAEDNIRDSQAQAIDFDDSTGNDWLEVNQFSVVENKPSRRPDVLLFDNGLPLAALELKIQPPRPPRSGALSRSFRATTHKCRCA